MRYIEAGSRCKVVSVSHSCFSSIIGKHVVVSKVMGDVVMVYDDSPITYKTNRAGRVVVDRDPRCIQTFFSKSQLRLT